VAQIHTGSLCRFGMKTQDNMILDGINFGTYPARLPNFDAPLHREETS
jgi:hypothetical protein